MLASGIMVHAFSSGKSTIDIVSPLSGDDLGSGVSRINDKYIIFFIVYKIFIIEFFFVIIDFIIIDALGQM